VHAGRRGAVIRRLAGGVWGRSGGRARAGCVQEVRVMGGKVWMVCRGSGASGWGQARTFAAGARSSSRLVDSDPQQKHRPAPAAALDRFQRRSVREQGRVFGRGGTHARAQRRTHTRVHTHTHARTRTRTRAQRTHTQRTQRTQRARTHSRALTLTYTRAHTHTCGQHLEKMVSISTIFAFAAAEAQATSFLLSSCLLAMDFDLEAFSEALAGLRLRSWRSWPRIGL